MKNPIFAAILTALLAACGGGSGGSNSQPVSNSAPTLPPSGTVSQPESKDQVVEAPTPPASAGKITLGGSFLQGAGGQNSILSYTGAANLNLSGRLNNIWLSAAQSGGSVTVSGDLNTIVFMPGFDTTLTVTGSGNTFYVPLGSPTKLEGAGLVSSTVRYYKP